MKQAEWCVLVNPQAGSRPPGALEVESAFSEQGVRAVVSQTQSPEHLRSIVAREVSTGRRDFVVVGGDGTAHHALNAMMADGYPADADLTLSIIPTGSGSDFVRTFGHATGLGAGVARLREPDRYRIDVGTVIGAFGEVFFLNALNVGVAAASVAGASTLPARLGAKRYALGFWLALARFTQAEITTTIDHHGFSGVAINVVVANGQFFGGGMNVAPRATLTDGLFDVQVFAGPRRKAFTVMPRVIRGAHLTHSAVRRYVGAHVEITAPHDWPVEADGEILGTGSVRVTTIASAINFVA